MQAILSFCGAGAFACQPVFSHLTSLKEINRRR
jgi:hypothetical protein